MGIGALSLMSTIVMHLRKHPRPQALARRQNGFSLIVALMMLIVIILLGISGSQMAINEERGSRNDRDRQIAFQAAEAALKDAETEIYGTTSSLCTLPGQTSKGTMRVGTSTCFNETNLFGYVVGCSTSPNEGLCTYVQLVSGCNAASPTLCPAYLSANVNFLADAQGAATPHTVVYGRFTGRTFPSQQTTGTNQPVSAYPPRYIIEAVPKNTSFNTQTSDGSGGSAAGTWMFRITAMGFGANPNSQVVLQAVVATQY